MKFTMENNLKFIVIFLFVQFIVLVNCDDQCNIVRFCDSEDHTIIISANRSARFAELLIDDNLNETVVNCSLTNDMCSMLCCEGSNSYSDSCANFTRKEEAEILKIFNKIEQNIPNVKKCDCQDSCYVTDIEKVPQSYTIPSAISFCSLLITVLVYLSIKSLRNLHGKILLGYACSLLLAQGCHLFIQINVLVEGPFCKVAGYVLQFSLLSTFFWLNVTCYNIYRTLTGYHSLHCNKKMYHKKFIVFCLYCWGCPCILTMITFTIDNMDKLSSVHSKIGHGNCFFGTPKAQFYHFYSFISIIMLINVVFFVRIVSVLIQNHKKNAAVFNTKDSTIHNAKKGKRFFLYLQLFIIMGITWILEVISFYENNNNNNQNTFWDIVDIIITSHGVLIFLKYVCNRRVLNLLRGEMPNSRKPTFKNSSINSITYYNKNGKNDHSSIRTITTSYKTAGSSQ